MDINTLLNNTGLGDDQIAAVFGINGSTVYRWRQESARPNSAVKAILILLGNPQLKVATHRALQDAKHE